MRNILSTLIGAFGVAFLARAITQEDMGTLTVLTLIASLIQLASNFGLSQTLAKYVAELKGRGEDYSAYFASSIIFNASAATIACLTLFLFSGDISSVLLKSSSLYMLVRLTAIDAFILAFKPMFNSLLLGVGQLKRMAACDIASTAARWASIVTLVFLGNGVNGAVMGWIIGDLCSVILYAAASSSLIKLSSDLLSKSVSLIPRLLSFSWPLLTASMVLFIYTWYDQALVIAFLPLESVGIYNVSRRAFAVLVGISMALGQSLFPYYGMTYGRKNHEAIRAAIKKASRYTMLIIFPLTLGLSSTAKPVITLFAGQQYESGWPVLAILSIFGLTYGISTVLRGLLVIYEKTKTVMLINIVSVASSLLVLPILGVLGLSGLAVMKGASMLLTLLLNIYFLSKIIRVEIDKEAFVKTLVSSAVMAIAVFFMQQVYYSKFLLPLYVFIGAAIYWAEIRALRILNRADIFLVTKMLGERNAVLIAKLMGCDLNGQDD